MSQVIKLSFLRRVERWLVGAVMSAIAFVLEKAVLRSVKHKPKPKPKG